MKEGRHELIVTINKLSLKQKSPKDIVVLGKLQIWLFFLIFFFVVVPIALNLTSASLKL